MSSSSDKQDRSDLGEGVSSDRRKDSEAESSKHGSKSSSSSSRSRKSSSSRSRSKSDKSSKSGRSKADSDEQLSRSKPKESRSDKSVKKPEKKQPEHDGKKKQPKKKKSRSGSNSGSGSGKEESGSEKDSFPDSEEESKDSQDSESENSQAGKQSKEDNSPNQKGDDEDGFFRKDKEDNRSLNEEGLKKRLEEIRKEMKGKYETIDSDEKDNMWRDDDFPPHPKSLGRDIVHSDTMKQQYKGSYKWMRPKQILHSMQQKITALKDKEPVFSSSDLAKCDLKFGMLSDAVFTSALGLLAIHQNIDNLFVDIEHIFDMGYAVFQFFKNGEWRYVVVDTLLPYSVDKGSLLFSECNEPNEFWVPLVEKAYAKLNGSYQNIQNMDICEVLVDITGGVAEREELGDDKVKDTNPNKDSKDNPKIAALYSRITSYMKNKYILGCVRLNRSRHPSNKENGEKGIYENLYYGMMGLWEVGFLYRVPCPE
jgi:calpain